ncbi:hypothetical protein TGMAS_260810A [Toxoplasma gondii MAS]|uniref:Uncharacterized protein n=1 Tax=Toxoplasma gondii MAS TaxID=943118 RepID=A0A086QRQ8_TOXGO|nr:hypothetical protein TGMAS_260810A [Toxoplasma gondii MAS]
MQEHHPPPGPVAAEEALRCETLNLFRSQLHQLSRHKDRLMPKPDGSFPGDWLRLAWEYQSLAEQMMRSQRWPGDYPEGLLACVTEQVKYLRRRLGVSSAARKSFASCMRSRKRVTNRVLCGHLHPRICGSLLYMSRYVKMCT